VSTRTELERAFNDMREEEEEEFEEEVDEVEVEVEDSWPSTTRMTPMARVSLPKDAKASLV